MFTGALTWRRLWSLVVGLPPDASVVRAIHPAAQWTTEGYMLASIIDVLQFANWQRAGKKSNPRPKPIKRPGDKNTVGDVRTVADFEATYARARANIEQREDAGETVWATQPPA